MSRKEKYRFAILIIIAVISLFFSLRSIYLNTTVAIPTSGGEYREGIIGQPRLINPLLATNEADLSLVRLVFSGLYRYDGNGQLIPDLAEALPQITEDQKEYTISLKKNAIWHNGKPVTADDVVFTITTLQDSRYGSPLRNEWLNTTITKKDDYTVVFKLRDISGPFIHNLTLPIISRVVWDQVTPENFLISEGNIKPIGTGPYVMREIEKLPKGKIQTITLESFDKYVSQTVYIDKVVIKFYENFDEILNALHGKEITGFGFTSFDNNFYIDKNSSNLTIHQLSLPQYQALFFNTAIKPFNDSNVRKALVQATDKQQIIDQAFNGNARLVNGPILPEQLPGQDQVPGRDLEAAKQLLDNSGWKLSDKNIRTKGSSSLEFTISTNDSPVNFKTAELLQKQWQELGIKVNLNILGTKELAETKIRPRQYQALLFAENVGSDPDPFIFWHSSQTKNPGLNLSGYANKTADRLITEARSTTKTDIRTEKYREFQNIILADNPAIFLNQSVYVYALDKQIEGLSLTTISQPAFRFFDLPAWYQAKKRVLKKVSR